MDRLRLALTVPLLALLLVAQQGATLHELSHLRTDGRALAVHVQAIVAAQDSSRCLTCEAFAQIAHPAVGLAPLPAARAAAVPAPPDPLFPVIGASAPTPRSRGPPQA